MKHYLTAICAAALIAGCAPLSPRNQCLARAEGELPTLRELAQETQANIARGYGIAKREVPIEVERVCETRLPDGRIFEHSCMGIETRTRTEPVAIDLAAERAKLRSLEQRITREESRAAAAKRACIAAYPEAG